MINMMKLSFEPTACDFVFQKGAAQALLAMSEPSALRAFGG